MNAAIVTGRCAECAVLREVLRGFVPVAVIVVAAIAAIPWEVLRLARVGVDVVVVAVVVALDVVVTVYVARLLVVASRLVVR
jgi:hypothetical protein